MTANHTRTLGTSPTDYNAEIKPGPLELGFDYSWIIPATGDRVPCVWVENHRVANFDPADPIELNYLDFDYLPLPDLKDGQPPVAGAKRATKNKKRQSNGDSTQSLPILSVAHGVVRFDVPPLITLATILLSFIASLDAAEASKPNIIFILADDLGYGGLSGYGQTGYRTPHLDRMAAEGARLTQFNCPASFCAPTRASLLTGRYPFRCGMTTNPAPDGGVLQKERRWPLRGYGRRTRGRDVEDRHRQWTNARDCGCPRVA